MSFYLVLADDASVSEPVYHVLRARGKKELDVKLVDEIQKQSGCATVGDLRRLTDHEWRALAVPAICRIYLKYVIRQSGMYLYHDM
jgi:hypothetical protein